MEIDLPVLIEGSKQWLSVHGTRIGLALVFLFISLRVFASFINKLLNTYEKSAMNEAREAEREGVKKRMETIKGLLRQTGKIVIWVTFLFIIISELGINIAPLIASAGVVGLALGFGSQELVKDIISGFFQIWENVVRVGDFVTLNGISGTVESINLRTTKLRDPSGNLHIFRNGSISTFTNHTIQFSAILIDVGVAYDSDLRNVYSVLKQVGEELRQDQNFAPKITEEFNVLGLNNFGDSSLDIRVKVVTLPGEQWAVGREYRLRVKEAFDKEGIEIPFPQRVIHNATD